MKTEKYGSTKSRETFLFFILFLLFAWPLSAYGDERKAIIPPDVISTTAYGVGSSGYIQAAAIGNAINKKYGTKFRVVPAPSDQGRLLPPKMGKTDFSFSGIGAYFAFRGLFDFATPNWGPQNLRLLWPHPSVNNQLICAGDIGIKTLKDLKGKRISWIPGIISINLITTAQLAFAGLTWDDVERVIVPSYSAGLRSIVEGRIDCSHCIATSGIAEEVVSGARGYFWPEYPIDDKEGWKHSREIVPYAMANITSKGAGSLKERPRQFMTYFYPWLICYPDKTSAETVYWMTKAVHQSYDLFKDVSPSMPLWNIKDCITPESASSIPYHPAAIKYFKEVGVWTDEHQRYQDESIALSIKLKKAWRVARMEADEKGLAEKDFASFWMKKYEQIAGIKFPEVYWELLNVMKQ